MAREHVADRVLNHRVVGGHDRAARIAEADLDPFPYERFPQDLGTREGLADAVGHLGAVLGHVVHLQSATAPLAVAVEGAGGVLGGDV